MIRSLRYAHSVRCISSTVRWSTWRRRRAWSRPRTRILKEITVFNYYFGLAVRSLKRNIVLTVLMIAAIGVGIGASMTTLTMFRAMDHDPIPQKSRQLFAVQIDNWGPKSKNIVQGDKEHLQEQISYIDAIGLVNAKAAHRQSAMYVTGAALTPS